MRKKRTVVILLIIVLYCIIPLYLSLHKKTVVYSSPEEYCVSNGYDYYQITWGESSAFAMYKKAPGKVGFKILQKTEKGFETVRYQIVSTVFFGPISAKILKGKGMDDNFVFFSVSGKYNTKVIQDAKGSTFLFLPFYTSKDEKTEVCSFVSAYIGTESKDYYKHDYWYAIETKDGAN